MSYHAKRLTAHGLTERQTSGKHKQLTLTAAGRTLIDRALPLVLGIQEQQFSDLSEEELELLRNLLRRLK